MEEIAILFTNVVSTAVGDRNLSMKFNGRVWVGEDRLRNDRKRGWERAFVFLEYIVAR